MLFILNALEEKWFQATFVVIIGMLIYTTNMAKYQKYFPMFIGSKVVVFQVQNSRTFWWIGITCTPYVAVMGADKQHTFVFITLF